MIISGAHIAESVLKEVREAVSTRPQASVPKLAIITIAPNFETEKYLSMKQKKADYVGIELSVKELPADSSTADVIVEVTTLADVADGIVVQLPLPQQIDVDEVLKAIPTHKDPDGFSYLQSAGAACLPPVVAAIDEIVKRNDLSLVDKKVIILGSGRLVGAPAALYCKGQGADVQVFTRETFDANALKTADIIISGIGRPHFITPDLVKDDVAIFDAGTSEDNGALAGDFDPRVADKSSIFTPVPGGIGPIAIACLLRNLIDMNRQV